jgi:ribosomal protein S27AE
VVSRFVAIKKMCNKCGVFFVPEHKGRKYCPLCFKKKRGG